MADHRDGLMTLLALLILIVGGLTWLAMIGWIVHHIVTGN